MYLLMMKLLLHNYRANIFLINILQWLKEESNKCPVCRHELCSKEKKIEYIPEFNNVVLPNESNETNETHPYGAENRGQSL